MTTAREAAELVEVLSHPTTKAREAAEFVEVLAHPTTKARAAAVFVEILIGPPLAPAPPLALRRRPDDNSTGSPLLPRFHGTPQRSSALGAGSGW